MKGRIFWVSLFLIGISWVANVIYAQSKQLDEPIFLDHFIDTTLQENVHIPLYYLTNLNDSSSISHVNIDGMINYVVQDNFFSDFGFNYHSEDHQNLQTFTHHALRNIQLDLNTFDLENMLQDGKFTFNEIEVFFNDGKNIIVPIGEITLHADHPPQDMFESLGGSSSSDGSSESIYRVKEDLSIENITFKYDDTLQNHLLVKIEPKSQSTVIDPSYTGFPEDWEDVPGIDIEDIVLPYHLEKGEAFYIHTQVLPEFIGYTESTFEFSGTTQTGETFTHAYWVMSQLPYLSQKDVNKMIKK